MIAVVVVAVVVDIVVLRFSLLSLEFVEPFCYLILVKKIEFLIFLHRERNFMFFNFV